MLEVVSLHDKRREFWQIGLRDARLHERNGRLKHTSVLCQDIKPEVTTLSSSSKKHKSKRVEREKQDPQQRSTEYAQTPNQHKTTEVHSTTNNIPNPSSTYDHLITSRPLFHEGEQQTKSRGCRTTHCVWIFVRNTTTDEHLILLLHRTGQSVYASSCYPTLRPGETSSTRGKRKSGFLLVNYKLSTLYKH